MSSKIVAGVTIAVICSLLFQYGLKKRHAMRIDRQNLVLADGVKERFEQAVPIGTPISRVADYVRGQGFQFQDPPATHAGIWLVILYSEDSPRLGCSQATVYLIFNVKDGRYVGDAHVSEWDVADSCK